MEQTLAETNAESEFFIAPIVDMKRVKQTVDAVIEFMKSVMVKDIDMVLFREPTNRACSNPAQKSLQGFSA